MIKILEKKIIFNLSRLTTAYSRYSGKISLAKNDLFPSSVVSLLRLDEMVIFGTDSWALLVCIQYKGHCFSSPAPSFPFHCLLAILRFLSSKNQFKTLHIFFCSSISSIFISTLLIFCRSFLSFVLFRMIPLSNTSP